MKDKIIAYVIIFSIIRLLLSIIGFFVYHLLFIQSTYKNFKTTGIITEMEYEEEEWDTKTVTKKVNQSDGTTKNINVNLLTRERFLNDPLNVYDNELSDSDLIDILK